MKRSYVLAGTIVLLAIMFASIGFAAAQTEYYPTLEIKLNGMIWYFKTYDDTSGAFNGMKIIKSSIVAYYYDMDGLGPYTIKPVAIVTTKNWVMLVFCPKSLPTFKVSTTGVTGDLTNGDNFIASGGGFAWGGIR